MSSDNDIGQPMFNPHLTGHELRGQDLADWIAFCEALVADEDTAKLYNTWFETRWMRASEKAGGQGKTRAQSVVRAVAANGIIGIRCPTKIWAENLREIMPNLRGLSCRNFWVLAPMEDIPKPVSTEDLQVKLVEWQRLLADPNAPEKPEFYRRMISFVQAQREEGAEFLARHEQRNA